MPVTSWRNWIGRRDVWKIENLFALCRLSFCFIGLEKSDVKYQARICLCRLPVGVIGLEGGMCGKSRTNLLYVGYHFALLDWKSRM